MTTQSTYKVTPITRDGMTGVRLTDATSDQIRNKAAQIASAYEQTPHTYLGGELKTSINLDPDQMVEVVWDTTQSKWAFDYNGPVLADSVSGTFEVADVLVDMEVVRSAKMIRLPQGIRR